MMKINHLSDFDQSLKEDKKWLSDNISEWKRKTRMTYHSGLRKLF